MHEGHSCFIYWDWQALRPHLRHRSLSMASLYFWGNFPHHIESILHSATMVSDLLACVIFPPSPASWAKDTPFPFNSHNTTHLQTTLCALLCQQHTGSLLSIGDLHKWNDCQKEKKKLEEKEMKKVRQKVGWDWARSIYRKLPQAESWTEPSWECHHSATPADLMLNTLQNKTGRIKWGTGNSPQFVCFPGFTCLIQWFYNRI